MIQVHTTKPAAPEALASLTHNRWALPVLALVSRSGGGKFVTLSRQLRASPSSVKRALVRLAELGLVVRNPGYGHPMRPEYVLGPVGLQADGLSQAIVDWMVADRIADEVLKKWHLPALLALGSDARRFGEIRSLLPTATPRAVTMALKSHGSRGLLLRTIDPAYPPVPLYAPTPLALPGREPARLLGELLAAS